MSRHAADNKATAVTVGNFDGVHLGHRALLARARGRVGESGRVVVLAFEPHPLAALRPAHAPATVASFETRQALLCDAGADEVHRLDPAEVLGLPAERFVDQVVQAYRPAVWVEGADFRFGKERTGDNALLALLGRKLGFDAVVVDDVCVALTDQTVVRASSSRVRWLLRHGRVRDAAYVLGRAHEVRGRVVRGDGRGRTIGFPTANLQTDDLLPAAGVYACFAKLPGGLVCPAAVNSGLRPTFENARPQTEAHLLLDDDEAVPAPGTAGWPLRLRFVARVRDELRFASIDELKAQIARDVRRTRVLLSHAPYAVPEGRVPTCAVGAPQETP